MPTFYSGITVLREDSVPILLSGDLVTHPPKKYVQFARQILPEHNVGTILNVSVQSVFREHHELLYKDLGIHYEEVQIEDTIRKSVCERFNILVLEVYKRHVERIGATKAFLINCSAGINRSGLAAAIILWETTIPRPWTTCDQLVEEMRKKQKRYRGNWVLLTNLTFVKYLESICNST